LDNLTASGRLLGRWAVALSPRLAFSLEAGAYRNQFFGGAFNPANSRYARVASAVTWQATQHWDIEAGASRADVAYSGVGISASGDSVYLSAKFQLERASAHR
jgi:hypothetical protein